MGLDEDAIKKMMAASQFYTILENQLAGDTRVELDKAVKDIYAAVTDFGGTGEVTLTIKFKQATGPYQDTFEISDDVKVKLPKPPRAKSFIFGNGADGFVTQQQDQKTMEFTPSSDTTNVRSIKELNNE